MLTKETIRTQFQRLLAENNIHKELQVQSNPMQPFRMTIDQKEDSLTLAYNPGMITYSTKEELLFDLRHELCHVIKSPTSAIILAWHPSQFVINCMKCYIDIFREYIAEKEYLERFCHHMKGYLAHRRNLYTPTEIIEKGTEYLMTGNVPHEDGYAYAMSVIYIIFSESACYHVGNDTAFAEFCRQRNSGYLETLFSYVMEDMQYIAAKPIPYMEQMELVLHSFYLCICIDAQSLWNGQGIYKLDIAMPPHIDNGLRNLWNNRNIPRIRENNR